MNGKESACHPRTFGTLRRDGTGAVLIEAAVALPILILLLLGIVTYGGWFMAAHSLQQAANDAARAALAGIDAAERQGLVEQSLVQGVIGTGTLNTDLITVTTSQADSYYTVSLSYEIGRTGLFSTSLVPPPGETINRIAVVRLGSP